MVQSKTNINKSNTKVEIQVGNVDRVPSTKLSKKSSMKSLKKKKHSHEHIDEPTIRLSDIGIRQKTPLELDLDIQIERILHILDKTVRRLKIASNIPSLLQDGGMLMKKYLSPENVHFIMTACSRHTTVEAEDDVDQPHISDMINAIDRIAGKTKAISSVKVRVARVDPHICQVVDLIVANSELKSHLQEKEITDSKTMTLISSMKALRDIAESRLKVTAREEKAREQELKQAWRANAITKESIENLQEQLQKQRKELNETLETKNKTVELYQERIELLEKQFREDVKTKILDSEKNMSEDTHASELRQVELAEEARIIANEYEILLDQNLKKEKVLRTKRSKVETQLVSWLTKYDQDVGDRQAELEEVTAGYEQELAEMTALQEKFDEQEEEYQELLAEKLEEERIAWEEKVENFRRERAAKFLQRRWRIYWQKKLESKKGKKGKKGK